MFVQKPMTDEEKNGLSEAIRSIEKGFNWARTRQGRRYWEKVCCRLGRLIQAGTNDGWPLGTSGKLTVTPDVRVAMDMRSSLVRHYSEKEVRVAEQGIQACLTRRESLQISLDSWEAACDLTFPWIVPSIRAYGRILLTAEIKERDSAKS